MLFGLKYSNVIISCSVNKEVSNYIQKKVLNCDFKKNENPMGFFLLEQKNSIEIPWEKINFEIKL